MQKDEVTATIDAERQGQLVDSFSVYCSILSPEERELLNNPIIRARVIERCVLSRSEKDILYDQKTFDIKDPSEVEYSVYKLDTREIDTVQSLIADNPQIKVIKIAETHFYTVVKKLRKLYPNILLLLIPMQHTFMILQGNFLVKYHSWEVRFKRRYSMFWV